MSELDSIQDDPNLRRRIGWTLGALAVYRVGAALPVPGVDGGAVQAFLDSHAGGLFGFLNVFSGGSLGTFSLFSLGVMPYVNAFIVMSLLEASGLFPALDRLAKEGKPGRRKLNDLARRLTAPLAAFQAAGLIFALAHGAGPDWISFGTAALTLTAGALLVMWLAELITESGLGSGVPLLVFAGLAGRILPSTGTLLGLMRREEINLFVGLAIIAALLAGVAAVAWIETAQRKLPIQYAQRVVGRRMYAGSQSAMPLKVDQAGIVAVILAASLLSLPLALAQFAAAGPWGARVHGGRFFGPIYAALIVFFACFRHSASVDPAELAENLKKSGGFVPGVRAGQPTAERIAWIMKRLALGGALFVAALAVLPGLLGRTFDLPFFFGGTSLLIVVGVALDSMGQIETHIMMRRYESALKKQRR